MFSISAFFTKLKYNTILLYSGEDGSARQIQKCFMKRRLGLPSNYLTATLLNRLQQFNRYIPYLPGIGAKFETDDIREMLHEALPSYVHVIISTSDYKWEDGTKTDSEVSSYFDRLIVIGTMARTAHDKPKTVHKRADSKHSKFTKNNTFKGQNKKKPYSKCAFCGNTGHEETKCRIKAKASADAQNTNLSYRKTMSSM
jgi:hypothetical protein